MYIIYKPWVYILDIYIYYEKNFGMCVCLWPEFDWYKVTLCGWQDIKIQLLTDLRLFWCFIHINASRTVHAKLCCKLSLERMILDKILTEIMVMAKKFKTDDNNSCATWRTGLFSCFETHVIKATYFCYQNNITHTHTRCTRFSAHCQEWQDV